MNFSSSCLVLENISFSVVMQKKHKTPNSVPLFVQMEKKDYLQETV